MTMAETIIHLKNNKYFNDWESCTSPNNTLIQYVYDCLYPDKKSLNPGAEEKAEIKEFLRIIKENY